MSRMWELGSLYGGGPGSGCHGPNCGRPETVGRNKMVSILRKTGLKIRKIHTPSQIRKAYDAHLKAQPVKQAIEDKQRQVQQDAAQRLAQNLQQYPKAEPKDTKKQIAVAGVQLTVLKPKGQYDKTNETWLRKNSPYKGMYHRLYAMDQYGDPNTKNSVWVYRDAKRGQMIRVSRHLGSDKGVSVQEVDTMDFEHIMRTREARFKDNAKAEQLLSRRYGIAFKIEAA